MSCSLGAERWPGLRRRQFDRADLDRQVVYRSDEKVRREQEEHHVERDQRLVVVQVLLRSERRSQRGSQHQQEQNHVHDAATARKLRADRRQLATERTASQLIAQRVEQERIEAVAACDPAHAGRRLDAAGRHVRRTATVDLAGHGALAIGATAAAAARLGEVDDALAVLSRTGDAHRRRLADQQAVARAANVLLAGRSDLDGLFGEAR